MKEETIPHGRLIQRAPAVREIDILRPTAGLGCDGDNPILAYENGDDFLEVWHRAAAGELNPFILVVEGSVPNEKRKREGYWAAGYAPSIGSMTPGAGARPGDGAA